MEEGEDRLSGGNKEMKGGRFDGKTVAILQWLKAKHILLQLCKQNTHTHTRTRKKRV